MIYALQKLTETSNTYPYEKNSERMAELARDYHESLQRQGSLASQEEREGCIRESLEAIQVKITPQQKKALKRKS